MPMIFLGLIPLVALLLAFANGANDNAKGVATLIGCRTLPFKRAIGYAGVMTLLGSFASIFLAAELADRFSGKGLVDAAIVANPAFAISIGIAAGLTVLLATRLSFPISTTHAIVGSIIGVSFAGGAVNWARIGSTFFLPLLLSPAIAFGLAAIIYLFFRTVRRGLGVTHETCVCAAETIEPVGASVGGDLAVARAGVSLSVGDRADCRVRYSGRVVGVEVQSALNWAHMFTSGAVSFARGLNDTPKIAALMIAAGAFAPKPALILTGIAIALGGWLAVRRVAETMSYRITEMNDGQAFSANLVTATLVIFASKWGLPVSTTHVSCGSLFGIGLAGGQAKWKVITGIFLAWIITLPVAALLGYVAWMVLRTLPSLS